MKPDSIAYVVAGMCFGIILGWVIGTQQARSASMAIAPAAAPVQAQSETPAQRQPPALDEATVKSLTAVLAGDPKNVDAMVQLGNTYFDAERFDDAITWYQNALKLDPSNADASTDLGVSYFYTDRPDDALAQFERSLKIDPRHTKTMLNKGIVLAFGKQDIRAASEEWKKVVTMVPDSAEGQAARKMLEGIASAPHAGEPATANQ
jgi:cytochrome c-type biogenesis protein CcmH/NrfG